MKRGRWIGSLLLVGLACIAPLRAQEMQWQAVAERPSPQTPAVTLDSPQALAAPAISPPSVPPSQMVGTGGGAPAMPRELLPVSFETAIPVAETSGPRAGSVSDGSAVANVSNTSGRPAAEIIAVSAPVTAPAAPPTEEQEETSESLFAVDRLFPQTGARPEGRGARGDGLSAVAYASDPSSLAPRPSPLAPVPGWDAPVGASGGTGIPADADMLFPSSFNPLQARFYASAEYLMWWLQGQATPVLATTSAPSDFGVLGAPTTQILFGGNQINGNSPFSGGRFTVGYWLGCNQSKALEFTGFFLGTRSAGFATNSSLNPVIGRPFIEANNGQETAQLTALPGVSSGALTIAAPTSLWGLMGNLRCCLCSGCNYRISALGGFRNINLDESLTITENVLGLSTAPPPFTNQMITVTDSFATQNHFYGGNLGADVLWFFWGRWSVEARGQVALGDTVQLLDISGSQHFVPGVPTPTGVQQNFTGGLLALPSNIGHFQHNTFSVVPEISVNLGYQVLPNLRAFVGYNFLYWSNVIRPGTSINPVLDVTQIPNFPLHPEPAPAPGNPAPIFHEVGLWAQGLTFGLEFFF